MRNGKTWKDTALSFILTALCLTVLYVLLVKALTGKSSPSMLQEYEKSFYSGQREMFWLKNATWQDFRLKAYIPKDKLEGRSSGLTYMEGQAIPYFTVAVDPKVVPLGAWVYIKADSLEGWFRATDTGSLIKGKVIDICVPDRGTALRFGTQRGQVVVLY
ncbi:MAG: 3D domain-containing protein [candidate division Zixibacteria bacterium]|nr:3D domain-containing protein [candidate division Zixibacteria bacterium]